MNMFVEMHEWQSKFKIFFFFLHINCLLKCIVELLLPIVMATTSG